MQIKHLIIFSLVGIAVLLAFNIINDYQRDKDREMALNSATSEQSTTGTQVSDPSSSNNIANKPLGEQPKAILDDATAKIDQAQQTDQARLVQMDDAAK
ncbi:hypothetical protein [Psychrobacter alimentarius]|uniref:hypothetical protein n=1 Tax=Psychrobacter alimentarius TaxID=261164 RepID=UPI003FD4E4D4